MGWLDFLKAQDSERIHDKFSLAWLGVDMHSHLIPGIDDGSKSLEESVSLIRRLEQYGLRKIITTPHIMSEYYRNTPEIILNGLDVLKNELAKHQINIEISAAAEYYIDEFFVERIKKGDKLLTISKNLVLVETGFVAKPLMLKEILFDMEMQGYRPILAHPERYQYLMMDRRLLQELLDRDVYFQANLLSFTGFYSKQVKEFAEMLLEKGKIRYLGTDCHNERYLDALQHLSESRVFGKLRRLPFMNHEL
jgi:tyrosine-protein phosphatase YwqE